MPILEVTFFIGLVGCAVVVTEAARHAGTKLAATAAALNIRCVNFKLFVAKLEATAQRSGFEVIWM
jgi:hypothetical protein